MGDGAEAVIFNLKSKIQFKLPYCRYASGKINFKNIFLLIFMVNSLN